jgi:hypothetical protein
MTICHFNEQVQGCFLKFTNSFEFFESMHNIYIYRLRLVIFLIRTLHPWMFKSLMCT